MSYTWDAALRRYRDGSGRLVADSTIRDMLRALTDATRQHTARLTQSYLAGDIGIAQWHRDMKTAIRTTHSAAAATARGGWGQMTKSDWGWAGSRVKKQYTALKAFKTDLQDHAAAAANETEGTVPADGAVLHRAAMYGESAKVSYHGMVRRMQAAAGATEARRVRTKTDSCDTCIREDNRGWVAIEDVVPIGDSECLTHCGCHIEYRQ